MKTIVVMQKPQQSLKSNTLKSFLLHQTDSEERLRFNTSLFSSQADLQIALIDNGKQPFFLKSQVYR